MQNISDLKDPNDKFGRTYREINNEKKHKFNIYYILMAVWGVLILQNLIFGQFRPKVIPYSEFIDAVMNDRVIEISVGADTITGRMKGGENNQEERC